MATRTRWTVHGRTCGHILAIHAHRAGAALHAALAADAGLDLAVRTTGPWDRDRIGRTCRLCTVTRPKPAKASRGYAALRTRSPRWRAGSRANRRHHTVPTFPSDRKATSR